MQCSSMDEILHSCLGQSLLPSDREGWQVRFEEPSSRHLYLGRVARALWPQRADGHNWPKGNQERVVYVQGYAPGRGLEQLRGSVGLCGARFGQGRDL